jgi:hypothetical protein
MSNFYCHPGKAEVLPIEKDNRNSVRLARCLGQGSFVPAASVMGVAPAAPLPEQLLLPASETLPGKVAEQWRQLFAQKALPLDPVDSVTLALWTQHVLYLRAMIVSGLIRTLYAELHTFVLRKISANSGTFVSALAGCGVRSQGSGRALRS